MAFSILRLTIAVYKTCQLTYCFASSLRSAGLVFVLSSLRWLLLMVGTLKWRASSPTCLTCPQRVLIPDIGGMSCPN